MKNLNRLKLVFLLTVSVFLISACGGGTTVKTKAEQVIAIDKIATYAKNGITLPTLQDYKNAGLIGITEENLEALNNTIETLTSDKADTKEELQDILDDHIEKLRNTNKAIEKIATYAKNGSILPILQDYKEAGLIGINEGNLEALNNAIEKLAYIDTNTKEKLQSILQNLNVKLPDTKQPTITLNGESTITLTKGDIYTEAGATATDDEDGAITVIIIGNVNTAKVGHYTVTYTAEDKAKNKATISRAVIIKEKEVICAQVITHAYNPNTKEEKDFPTPCDVPKGWIIGVPPVEKDAVAPVITFLGNETITLNVGDNYIDAGATASDDKDGDITNTIVINNPVNTSVAGTYTVAYNVDDAAGNHAIQLTRTVIINPLVEKDTVAPVLTLLGNETITLNVGDDYIDAGATASDDKDGGITNSIVINNPVNTSVAGTYTVAYNVDDAAGNHATQLTRSVKVNPVINRMYGTAGSHNIGAAIVESVNANSVIITPADINAANPVPVVFFAPGFKNTDYKRYQTLLNFIASHGYAVIFANDTNGFSSDVLMNHIKEMVNNPDIKPLIDTSRIGVIGHSSGGGHAFRILKELSDINNEGWGNNGRFLLALEPWFAFDMSKNDMKNMPSNANVIIQQYGIGGNNIGNNTDARIPLTEYYLLDSIADKQKDYQVFSNANHSYPYIQGDYSEMQGILKPLDALMELTFKETPDVGAQQTALEVGNDDPYMDGHGIQKVKLIRDYRYKCHGANTIINYCEIFPGALPPESGFNRIVTNTKIAKPELGQSIIDQEFGKTITRMTDRVNQNDTPKVNSEGEKINRGNAHPYPKTQAWNSDMSIIRMRYRLYDANTLKELPITSGTDSLSKLYYINGALNEMKWSSIDPNVFYGVYNGAGDYNGNFWKGTINASRTAIKFDLVKSFASKDYTYDQFTIGKYEGNIDYNNKYIAFAARKTGQKYLTAIVYNIENNTIRSELDFPNVAWPDSGQVFDWLSVSPLGNHILMSTGGKIEQYDMSLQFVRRLANSGGHGDLGVDQDGIEAYVQYEYGINSGIWIYRLSDGFRIRLLPDKYNGGHISCRNYNRQGWCYAGTTTPGYKDVIAIKLDYSGPDNHIVNRFGQTQTSKIVQSMANVSPDGKRILFNSDWGDDTVHWTEKDTYQIK